jgi:drug/metabolite transporter (DMT)-like permease
MNRTAVLYALASAVLFGVSTPAAKVLVGSIHPATLAGLLYCGAGVGVAGLRRTLPAAITGAPETALSRADVPWLAAAIGAGGILGPLLLMFGLTRTDAATASLLLTLEGAATALMAWFIFHENFDRRIAVGMASIVAGAAILSWSGVPSFDSIARPLAIAGACVSWGLDNNLTRKVSLADPLQIAMLKGLIAGPFNLILGLSNQSSDPNIFWHPPRWRHRFSRLWREPCPFRGGPTWPGNSADRCIFFHGTFHWQRGSGRFVGRTDNRTASVGSCFDGRRRCLVTPDRASRARAFSRGPRAHASSRA